MAFSVRSPAPLGKRSEQELFAGFAEKLPTATLNAALAACGRQHQRCRKLPAALTLLLPIAASLFPDQSQAQVLHTLLQGLRFLDSAETPTLASKSAICQARQRLGPRPLVALFRRVCRPLATPETLPDAFYARYRLLALDGTREDTPDSPANADAFDRPRTQRGEPVGAFPQVWAVSLLECGTHAVVDAGVWPCRTGARTGGYRLLRSVDATRLLLWDCGFHSDQLAKRARARGAHFLGRLPAHVKPVLSRHLPDGTDLVWLYPGTDSARRGPDRLVVRLLRYAVTDPSWGTVGTVVRGITSLLNPVRHPALTLIALYHQRWEVELGIDERDTHLRQLQQPLRSRTPLGVLQDLYGLLLAQYLVRSIMLDAGLAAAISPLQLSFTNAVKLITKAVPLLQLLPAIEQQRYYGLLLSDIAHFRLPPRDTRRNPRVVRRKTGKFKAKRQTDRGPTRRTCPLRDGIRLI